jgi:hypothetical protein
MGLIIVAMDRPIEGLDIDTVTVDNEFGAREGCSPTAQPVTGG